MDRILLLNNQYPDRFNSISVTPPAGMIKSAYVEMKIVSSINKYNPKLNVTHIEYLDIETQFPSFIKGKANGVLVEEFDIDPRLEQQYRMKGCFVSTAGTRCICRKIIMYVFISDPTEDTRTAYISQTVFPTLIDYAKMYIDSPSYCIANHNFCFINIMNKQITAKMILRHLAGLCEAGMHYIDIFDNDSIDPRHLPLDLKSFLELYISDYSINYDSITNVYEDDNYRVEFNNRKFIWKATPMASRLVPQAGGYVGFKGSNEKFYWIELLPIALFAYNQGYIIDYTDYENFIANYRSQFPDSSEKFARCEILLRYIKKYFINK